MRSLLVTVSAILALALCAAPALARPADNFPKPTPQSQGSRPVQVAVPDDGTATIVYVLIGLGGALSLVAAGYLGSRALATHAR